MTEDNLKNEATNFSGISNSRENMDLGSWEYQISNAMFSINPFLSRQPDENAASFQPDKTELDQYIHPKDYQYIIQNLNALIKDKANHFSATIRIKNGPDHYVKAILKSKQVILDENNSPEKIIGSIRLISGDELRFASFCNDDKCYRQLISAIPGTSVMVFDRNLEIQLYEGSKKEFIRNEVEGMSIYELFPQRMISLLEPVFLRALKGEATSFEHEYLQHTFHRHILPLRNELEEIENGLMITVDISASKRVEKIITQNLSWYRSIMNQFEEGLAIFENNKIIYASPAYHHWFGFEIMKDVSFEQVAEAVHPDDLQYVTSRFYSGSKGKAENKQYQYRIIRADGSILWLEDHLKNEYSREGKHLRTIVTTHNISAFRKTEAKNAELVKELEFHQQIHDVLGEGIALLDNQQRFVFANPATGLIFETTPEVLIYSSLEDYRIEDFTGPVSESDQKADESSNMHYIVINTEEGNKKILRYHTFPFFLHSHLFADLAIFRDVTREIELIRHNAVLESILNEENMGYIQLNLKASTLKTNEWVTSRLGYQNSDLQKLTPQKLLDNLFSSEEADDFKQNLKDITTEGKASLKRKGFVSAGKGEKIYCNITMLREADKENQLTELTLFIQEIVKSDAPPDTR